METPLFNAFMAIGLLVVIILIVYLVDRVNHVEQETHRMVQSMSAPPAVSQQPFGGLSGKTLWDALSGKPPEGMAEAAVQEVRSQYEPVLHKHIQSLFDEGVRDGQRGLSGEPKNSRLIRGAKAAVESWMPAAQANTLYKCGLDSTQQPPEALEPVRAALDEAGQQLFAKVQIDLKEPLSSSLLPKPSGEPLAALPNTAA